MVLSFFPKNKGSIVIALFFFLRAIRLSRAIAYKLDLHLLPAILFLVSSSYLHNDNQGQVLSPQPQKADIRIINTVCILVSPWKEMEGRKEGNI